MKKRILLIGPMPPPSGGVSVHVERLAKKINATNDFKCAVLDVGKMRFYNSALKQKNMLAGFFFFLFSSVVHIHISHRSKKSLARICSFLGKKVVLTVHNSREDVGSLEKMFKYMSTMIVVDQSMAKMFSSSKFSRVIAIPAFIPPEKTGNISPDIAYAMSTADRVILAIATHPHGKPVLHAGEDIYGFDLLLKAYQKTGGNNTLLLLVDVNLTMVSRYIGTVAELNREGKFASYFGEEINLVSLFPHIDVFVRPTRSDGDSVSIREALSSGVTVIASNCATRPEGVITFDLNNENDLSDKLREVLLNTERKVFSQEDYSSELLELYRELLNIMPEK